MVRIWPKEVLGASETAREEAKPGRGRGAGGDVTLGGSEAYAEA